MEFKFQASAYVGHMQEQKLNDYKNKLTSGTLRSRERGGVPLRSRRMRELLNQELSKEFPYHVYWGYLESLPFHRTKPVCDMHK